MYNTGQVSLGTFNDFYQNWTCRTKRRRIIDFFEVGLAYGGKIKIMFVVFGSISFQKPSNFAKVALNVAANLGFEKTISKK